MLFRLTVVLIAALVAFASSEPRSVHLETQAPPITAQGVPALKGFDDLPPTGPTTGAAPPLQRVAITVRPIPLPATRSAHPVTQADLDRAGVLADAYRSAAAAAPASCHLDVALLAAIGQIESGSAGGRQIGSDHLVRPGIFGPLLDGGPFAVIRDTDRGRHDGDSVWDRAVGPMQFIPSTWAWAGVDGDGDGKADPQNVYDAAHSAAGYLCRYNRDLAQPLELRAAIWAYNQSHDYVAAVLEWFGYFKGKGLGAVGSVSFRVGSGGRASQLPAVAPTTTAAKIAAAKAATTTTTTTAAPTTTSTTTTPTTNGAPTPSTTRRPLPEPVTTTPTSTTGPSATTPPPSTGPTPTTSTTTPTPTDTETCPTGEPTPTTSTTSPTPTTTTTTTSPTSEPTPTTTCGTSPTTATPAPTTTTTTAAEHTATQTATSTP